MAAFREWEHFLEARFTRRSFHSICYQARVTMRTSHLPDPDTVVSVIVDAAITAAKR